MGTVDSRDDKAERSAVGALIVEGEPFIIAEAGTPLVKGSPLVAPGSGPTRRLGLLAGQISVPDDFDEMGRDEIEQMFGLTK